MKKCTNPTCDKNVCELKNKDHYKCGCAVTHRKTGACLYCEEE